MDSSLETNKVLVIGNRWASLALVASHVLAQKKVEWVYPNTGRFFPVFPNLGILEKSDLESAIPHWYRIFAAFGLIESEEFSHGHLIREFRNKSFRIPKWIEAPSVDERLEERESILFGPEKRVCPYLEFTYEKPFFQLIQKVYELLLSHPLVDVKKDVMLSKMEVTENNMIKVRFSDQSETVYSMVYGADDLEQFKNIFGFLSGFTLNEKRVQCSQLLRKWELGGILQVEFTHFVLPDQKMDSGWVIPLTRESYEAETRHALGYFDHSENKSRWTVFLTNEEQENNQEIAKKIRRLKQALNKAFSVQDFFSDTQKKIEEWSATIEKENVALMASSVSFASKEVAGFLKAVDCPVYLLNDFFGPEQSIHAVWSVLSKDPAFEMIFLGADQASSSIPQSENTDALHVVE